MSWSGSDPGAEGSVSTGQGRGEHENGGVDTVRTNEQGLSGSDKTTDNGSEEGRLEKNTTTTPAGTLTNDKADNKTNAMKPLSVPMWNRDRVDKAPERAIPAKLIPSLLPLNSQMATKLWEAGLPGGPNIGLIHGIFLQAWQCLSLFMQTLITKRCQNFLEALVSLLILPGVRYSANL